MTTAPGPMCRYRYDALDLITSLECAGQASVQRFYRHQHLVTERQGQASQSVFQQGEQLLAVQSSENHTLKNQLLATDQQRSVLQLIDSLGRLPQVYTAYGHPRAESGLSSLLGFNGERRDPVTGHYLLGNGHRAYNPVLMRFNSPDRLSPFGQGGLNSYAYCLGDPVNFSDPTGRFAAFARILSSLAALFNAVITLRPGIPFQLGLDALANGVVFRSPLRQSVGAVSAVSAGIMGVGAAAVGVTSTIVAAVNPASNLLSPMANTSLGLASSSMAGRFGSWWAARDPAVLSALKRVAEGAPAGVNRAVAGARRPSNIVIEMEPMPSSSGYSPSAPLEIQTPFPSAPPQTPGVIRPSTSRAFKRQRDGSPVLRNTLKAIRRNQPE
ncbi:MAG: hypothetical protein JWP42_2001 [Pseudomonas sp.]|nr:hypothetical protein [Pseudomonas sp.]